MCDFLSLKRIAVCVCVVIQPGLCSSSPLTLSGPDVVSDVPFAAPWRRLSALSTAPSVVPDPPQTADETSTQIHTHLLLKVLIPLKTPFRTCKYLDAKT